MCKQVEWELFTHTVYLLLCMEVYVNVKLHHIWFQISGHRKSHEFWFEGSHWGHVKVAWGRLKRLDSWLLWVTYEEEKLNKAQILVLFIPQCERSLNLNLLTVSSGWLIYKDCYFITVLIFMIFPLCYRKKQF